VRQVKRVHSFFGRALFVLQQVMSLAGLIHGLGGKIT
jgi:hypothetical protein